MRVLMYSDVHVSHRHIEYLEFLTRTLGFLEEQVKTLRPDALINCGDTLDTFGDLDVRDGIYASEFLKRLSALGPQHFILRGNHDTADREGTMSSTQIVCPERASLVSDPGWVDVCGKSVLFLPHSRDPAPHAAMLSEAPSRGTDAVVAHTDWIGCRLTPAFTSQSGLDPALYARTMPDIPIFAGHYHAPIDVGTVHFVGAPLYESFADLVVPQPRGFLLWESDSGEITRIANPHTYTCVRVDAKTKRELTKALAVLDPSRCRVKVYVPQKLMEDAQEAIRGYLWGAVYPTDAGHTSSEFSTRVSVRTSPEDAVKAAVSSAGDEYDRAMLESCGRVAMRGDL